MLPYDRNKTHQDYHQTAAFISTCRVTAWPATLDTTGQPNNTERPRYRRMGNCGLTVLHTGPSKVPASVSRHTRPVTVVSRNSGQSALNPLAGATRPNRRPWSRWYSGAFLNSEGGLPAPGLSGTVPTTQFITIGSVSLLVELTAETTLSLCGRARPVRTSVGSRSGGGGSRVPVHRTHASGGFCLKRLRNDARLPHKPVKPAPQLHHQRNNKLRASKSPYSKGIKEPLWGDATDSRTKCLCDRSFFVKSI